MSCNFIDHTPKGVHHLQEIKINQAGYYPERSKVAIIPASGTTPFSIKNLHNLYC